MSRMHCATATLFLLAAGVASTGVFDQSPATTEDSDSCHVYDEAGPWSALLQDWAIGADVHHGRHGRIMALPPAHGYYVSDRMDGPLLSPPPPPYNVPHPPAHKSPSPPAHPAHPGYAPHVTAPRDHNEWQRTPPPPPNTGKIVNRPPNPYKDKFKPSYPVPPPNQPIPVHGPLTPSVPVVDRVDENRQPPQKQVSETDLYLLSAIEKLVYRADLMEKRLRKMEETVHYLVAGVDTKPEPCGTNFTRVGGGCYHFSSDAVNWKGANYACRKLKANMLEIDNEQERAKLTSALLSDKRLKGGDFWTGGLNPGLLWIWSHSARPVVNNSTSSSNSTHTSTIVGEGRCLSWTHDAAAVTYVYRGQDCALRHRYICEPAQDNTKLSNEIERIARNMKDGKKPKIVWTDKLT